MMGMRHHQPPARAVTRWMLLDGRHIDLLEHIRLLDSWPGWDVIDVCPLCREALTRGLLNVRGAA